MIRFIRKRDSRVVTFDISKIDEAIFRAAKAQGTVGRLEEERLCLHVRLARLQQAERDSNRLLIMYIRLD